MKNKRFETLYLPDGRIIEIDRETEIKDKEICFAFDNIMQFDKAWKEKAFKIIYHYPKLEGIPEFPKEFLDKVVGEDVEELANETRATFDPVGKIGYDSGFRDGSKVVMSRYKWTDEDMGSLWQYVVEGAKQLMIGNPTSIGTFDEYLQSLKQPQFNNE